MDRNQDFALFPGRFEGRADKVFRREGAACAVPFGELETSADANCRRRHTGSDVVPAEAAADGPSVPHLAVANVAGGIHQRLISAVQTGIGRDIAIARHRADAHSAVVDGNAFQLRNALEIDQTFGPYQPRLERLHEALPAGDAAGVRTMGGEGLQRFRQRRGRGIGFDRSWIHEVRLLGLPPTATQSIDGFTAIADRLSGASVLRSELRAPPVANSAKRAASRGSR